MDRVIRPSLKVARLTLTTARIIALGAVASKSIEFTMPEGYRLFLVRKILTNNFAFTNDLASMAKLTVSADFDGDPLVAAFPIDVTFGPVSTPSLSGVLMPATYLGYAFGRETASPGFSLRSIDTTDDSPGPNFSTMNPAVEGNLVLEIHCLLATVKEISL